MRSSMRALRGERRRDDGAAAVEFALLLPIFVLLVFGGLSAGTIFWHSINASQGTRDAARYGGTLPISLASPLPPNTYTMDAWLTAVTDVALREAGVGDTRAPFGTLDAADMADIDAYLCVAFVQGGGSTHLQTTTSRVTSAASGPATTQPCIATDGAPDVDRVQVVFKRDEFFNAGLIWKSLTTETQSVQPYERSIK
jgi:Flp pilus assembly protein TadG